MRRAVLWAGFALVVLLGLDVSRPPPRQLTNRALIAAVSGYRSVLSKPLSWMGVRCRFVPTCSRYAEVTLASHGVIPGLVIVGRRLIRCGPWTTQGTVDDPPVSSGIESREGRESISH